MQISYFSTFKTLIFEHLRLRVECFALTQFMFDVSDSNLRINIYLHGMIILFFAEEYGSFMHHVNFSRYCIISCIQRTFARLNSKCELNSYFFFIFIQNFLNSPFVLERGSLENLSLSGWQALNANLLHLKSWQKYNITSGSSHHHQPRKKEFHSHSRLQTSILFLNKYKSS